MVKQTGVSRYSLDHNLLEISPITTPSSGSVAPSQRDTNETDQFFTVVDTQRDIDAPNRQATLPRCVTKLGRGLAQHDK